MKIALRMLLCSVVLFCGASLAIGAGDRDILLQDPTRSYGAVNVILYETTWCPFCKKAHALLKDLGVSLVVYDVEKELSRRDEAVVKSGSRGVPVIDVEGIILQGYSENAIKTAVEKRRRR